MNYQQAIYKIALTRNKMELMYLITTTSIDAVAPSQFNFWSAAAQLAFEGNDEAVKFLKQHGANIHYIAYGYALGGHFTQVEEYRTRYRAGVHLIAQAYAIAGHTAQVELYRTRYRISIQSIAYGYAIGGHFNQVEECRIRYGAHISDIACGYARGGHIILAEAYRTKDSAVINEIVSEYDKGGHIKSKKDLLFIFTFSQLDKAGGILTRALYRQYSKIENKDTTHTAHEFFGQLQFMQKWMRPYQIMRTAAWLLKQAQFIQSRMKQYSLTFDEAHAWSLHAGQLMQFIYNDQAQRIVGGQDTFFHIIQILTGIRAADIPAFFRKIETMRLHQTPTEILLSLLEKLEQALRVYRQDAKNEKYHQSLQETYSLEQLYEQINTLKTSEKGAKERLQEVIALLKGHANFVEKASYDKNLYSNLFKPQSQLAKVYRTVLADLPQALVNHVKVSAIIALPEPEGSVTSKSHQRFNTFG